jgi:type II secretory pathway predicted ATPase ExeA
MNASLAAILQRLDDHEQLHIGPAFAEALARLHFATEHRFALAALVGASGTGKTTLLRRFRRELAASQAAIVQFQLAGLSEAELRTTIAEQLGLRQQRTWLRIVDRLAELAYDQTPLIVLADDAQLAPLESLEWLGRLWDAEPTGQLRITMILATDELGLAVWPQPWLQRIDLRVELATWSLEDATGFFHSVVADERHRQRGFEPAAIARLHQLSHGLPRHLRRLARLSLLATEGQQRTIVDEATVMGASHELCHVTTVHHDDGPAIEFVDEHIIE